MDAERSGLLKELSIDPEVSGTCPAHRLPLEWVCTDGSVGCGECPPALDPQHLRPLPEGAALMRAHLSRLCRGSMWEPDAPAPAVDLSAPQCAMPDATLSPPAEFPAEIEARRLCVALSCQLATVPVAAEAALADLAALRDATVSAIHARFAELEAQVEHARAAKAAALEAELVAADAALAAVQSECGLAVRALGA